MSQKQCEAQKTFWVKKNIWGPNIFFGSKRNVVSKKKLCVPKNLGPKNF